ncbi:MAG: GTP 3',8-cyclase MoaA [Daejeonella sp.]
MLIDSFARAHNYLRISLTDNCNLRCFYCMPEENYEFTPASRLMQPGEIESLARIFVENGVDKIRLTGGEPLVRKDAAEIIERLSALPVDLSLTTNATRLHDFVEVLEKARVRSLNISLDTLDKDKFNIVTRRDGFQRVIDNIHLLLSRNVKVKVNVVVMKGLNDNEIIDFVDWTKDLPVQVRFIEFMPFDGNRWTSNQVFTWKDMLDEIEKKYTPVRLHDGVHDTDKKYRIEGHKGSFSVISTMSAPFCSGCNRMRLTADGKMKNCLFSDNETDLLSALRNGQDVLPLIRESIHSKAKELGGQFTKDFKKIHTEDLHNRSMISIGG